jgi:hypothetical protein
MGTSMLNTVTRDNVSAQPVNIYMVSGKRYFPAVMLEDLIDQRPNGNNIRIQIARITGDITHKSVDICFQGHGCLRICKLLRRQAVDYLVMVHGYA